MGVWMLRSPEAAKAKGGPPEAMVGAFFIVFGAMFILTAWTLAGCLVFAGRSLTQRRRRTFCLVTAGVTALMCMPFGTVLGVLTLMVLLRPSVREAFEASSSPATDHAG
jgi:hypothetical protein